MDYEVNSGGAARVVTKPRQKAFTLLELLVVISIIAVLASMLMPTLMRATEKGKRATCLSNLHQFGIAVNLYQSDSNHRLLRSVQRAIGGGRVAFVYPGGMWSSNGWFPGQWNMQQMSQYIPGYRMDAVNRQVDVSSVWWCPSANDPNMRGLRKRGLFNGYFEPSYAYFAGAGAWNRNVVTKPHELTNDELQSDKILMSDTMFFFTQSRAWSYNHGSHGSADYSPANTSGQKDYGPPATTGMNQLYGDGHTAWKSINTNSSFLGTNGLGRIRANQQDTTYH